jgi:protein subunit release factor B
MLKGLEKIIARGTVGLLQNSRKRMQNLELRMMKQNAKLRNKLDSKQRKRQDESLKKSELLKNQKKK